MKKIDKIIQPPSCHVTKIKPNQRYNLRNTDTWRCCPDARNRAVRLLNRLNGIKFNDKPVWEQLRELADFYEAYAQEHSRPSKDQSYQCIPKKKGEVKPMKKSRKKPMDHRQRAIDILEN